MVFNIKIKFFHKGSLKQKIEWLLIGGFLTNKSENSKFAYGLDLQDGTFFSISKRSVKAKSPKRLLEETELPLDDIKENMVILKA